MIVVSPELLRDYLVSLRNPEFEPGYKNYIDILGGLNKICHTSGDPLEGNLFYGSHPNFADSLSPAPEARFRAKRRDYASYVMSGSSILEIGFNGGHSALLALAVNPNLKYTGIDFGNHPYTVPCFKYLKEFFGKRIELYIGDSRDLVPMIRNHGKKQFDLFHIDGGHDFGVAYADMCNVLDLCNDGDVILFDDTNSGVSSWLLDEICDMFVMRGLVSRQVCPRLWKSDQHVLLRVNKPG